MFKTKGHRGQVRVAPAQSTVLLTYGGRAGDLQEGGQVRVEDPGHARREDHPQHHQHRHPRLGQLSPGLPRGELRNMCTLFFYCVGIEAEILCDV